MYQVERLKVRKVLHVLSSSSNLHEYFGASLAHPPVEFQRLRSPPINCVDGVVEREQEDSDTLRKDMR